MTRSFTNRILGGVCGGLAAATPLSSNLWRLIFILLTLLTQGTGLAIYALFWWLLPLPLPSENRRRATLQTLLALLLSIGLLAGWFLRDTVTLADGQNVYGLVVLLVMAVVFFLTQLTGSKNSRANLLWSLVVIATLILILTGMMDMIPAGLFDTLLRAAPALLIFFGILVLLRQRVPYGGVIALIVSVGLALGTGYLAFSERQDLLLDQNTVTITESVAGVEDELLQVNISVLDTDVQFISAPPDSSTIRARYQGSDASFIESDYTLDGPTRRTFTLSETQPQAFPALEEVGRGTLLVELPQNVALDVAFRGDNGEAVLDLGSLNLERLNLDLREGDALVTLPVYAPRSPGVEDNPGRLVVNQGDLRILLTGESLGGRFVMSQAENARLPEYDQSQYAVEISGNEWILIARDFDDYAVQVNYVLSVPRGTVRLDASNSASDSDSEESDSED